MSNPESGTSANPAEQFREMRDSYMQIWAKAMGEFVNGDAYAQQSGVMLDSYLTMSQPFRLSMEKVMVNALQQLNMPTRPDVISLAERLTNLEMHLDDMDAKLERIEGAIAKLALPAKPEMAAPKAARATANATKGAR
jgi:hypothetical protein